MVIDAAKGIEARTRKLFEICRLRDIPILTFVNKMDREARDPFELLDEVSSTLALDTAPVTWPIGRAATFAGTYDLRTRAVHTTEPLGQSDPRMITMGEEIDLVRAALPEFELARAFNAGHLTPGVLRQRHQAKSACPTCWTAWWPSDRRPARRPPTPASCRRPRTSSPPSSSRSRRTWTPNHRDRIAFARVCSGRLVRGMRLRQVRTGKLIPLHAPQFFFARDRQIADEAFAGDVVGIPNHGTLAHRRHA